METKTQIMESKIISDLKSKSAINSKVLIGYAGNSEDKNRVLLYKSVKNLSESIEFSNDDILHYVDAPSSILPFGGVVVWLKKDAEVTYRNNEPKSKVENLYEKINEDMDEKQTGRLIMKILKEHKEGSCSSRCFGGHCSSKCIP